MPKKTPRPHTPDYNDESLRAHRELMFFVWTLFAATEHSASLRTEIRARHFEAIAMFCFNSTSGVPLIWSDNSAGGHETTSTSLRAHREILHLWAFIYPPPKTLPKQNLSSLSLRLSVKLLGQTTCTLFVRRGTRE